MIHVIRLDLHVVSYQLHVFCFDLHVKRSYLHVCGFELHVKYVRLHVIRFNSCTENNDLMNNPIERNECICF